MLQIAEEDTLVIDIGAGTTDMCRMHGTMPAEGDQIVERDGAIVYLDPAAAEVLAGEVLGVHSHDDHFHFSFDDQPA